MSWGNEIEQDIFFSFMSCWQALRISFQSIWSLIRLDISGMDCKVFLDPEPMNEAAWSSSDLVGGTMLLIRL